MASGLLLVSSAQSDGTYLLETSLSLKSAQIRCEDFNGLLIQQEGDYVRSFEVIWPLGSLHIEPSTVDARDGWIGAIFAAICDCVEPLHRTIGWRHHVRLGTVHSAVVSRDTMLLDRFRERCDEGLLEYSIFDLPE